MRIGGHYPKIQTKILEHFLLLLQIKHRHHHLHFSLLTTIHEFMLNQLSTAKVIFTSGIVSRWLDETALKCGFMGSSSSNLNSSLIDRHSAILITLIFIKGLTIIVNASGGGSTATSHHHILDQLTLLDSSARLLLLSPSLPHILITLFSDCDNQLITLLHSLLILYNNTANITSTSILPYSIHHALTTTLTPHSLFTTFITSLTFDASILVDLLISNETEFLAYFLGFLRFIGGNNTRGAGGGRSCTGGCGSFLTENQVVLSVLVELRRSVGMLHRQGLFPYSPEALLRRLDLVFKGIQINT